MDEQVLNEMAADLVIAIGEHIEASILAAPEEYKRRSGDQEASAEEIKKKLRDKVSWTFDDSRH